MKIARKVIEHLKKNNILFGDLPLKMQAAFKQIGKENCVYLHYLSEWKVPDTKTIRFYSNIVYRIKKDYQLPCSLPLPDKIRVMKKENVNEKNTKRSD